MLKNMKLWLPPVLAAVLLVAQSPVAAMEPFVYQSRREVPIGVVVINENSVVVKFWLRDLAGEWKECYLAPGADKDYKDKDYDRIWVSTEGGLTVFYTVEVGSRYRIFWNGQRGLWDVEKLEPRGR